MMLKKGCKLKRPKSELKEAKSEQLARFLNQQVGCQYSWDSYSIFLSFAMMLSL